MSQSIVKGEGAASVLTPSGISIRFESKPRRHYMIGTEGMPEIEGVSVTTALDVLYKGGLDWWGQRVGISGILSLIRLDKFALTPSPDGRGLVAAVRNIETGVWEYADTPIPGQESANIEAQLKEHKLRVDKIKESAGDRGDSVHDALEAWAITGKMPNPADYSPGEAPYVKGLVSFLQDSRIVPVRQEVLVASYDNAFAGRFDLECHSTVEGKVVTKIYPKAGPKMRLMPLGFGRLDLKTAKDVYFNNLIQLAGYEGASLECGYDPSDWQAVLRVSDDGRYELRVNPDDHRRITYLDFLQVLGTYHLKVKCEEAIKP